MWDRFVVEEEECELAAERGVAPPLRGVAPRLIRGLRTFLKWRTLLEEAGVVFTAILSR